MKMVEIDDVLDISFEEVNNEEEESGVVIDKRLMVGLWMGVYNLYANML